MFSTHTACSTSQGFFVCICKKLSCKQFAVTLSVNASITLAYSNMRRSVYMLRALDSWPARLQSLAASRNFPWKAQTSARKSSLSFSPRFFLSYKSVNINCARTNSQLHITHLHNNSQKYRNIHNPAFFFFTFCVTDASQH